MATSLSSLEKAWRGAQRWAQASKFDPLPIRRELAGYNREKFAADLKASLTLSLITLPMSMAIALMLGLPVSAGIIGAAAGAIIGPIFGTSRFVAPGPTNGTAAIVLSAFATLGPLTAAQKMSLVPPLLLLSGLILIGASLLGVATFAGFISRTVVTAYVTCAAERIITNQLPLILGVDVGIENQTFKQVATALWRQLGHISPASVLVSLGTWFTIVTLNRRRPGWPNPFIALILISCATSVVCRFLPDHLPVIRDIVPDLCRVQFLDGVVFTSESFKPASGFSLDVFGKLVSPAMALAFLCVVEATSIGRSLAAKSGERINANEVLFGMGMAKVVSGLFGGAPVSGSLTRSAASISAGAKTVMCGLLSGATIVIIGLTLGSLMKYVPQAALGAVVCHAALALFSPAAVRTCLTATRADKAVYLLTFGIGLIAPLDTAIYFGVGLSIVLFLRKAAAPEIVEYAYNDQGHLAEVRGGDAGLKRDPEVSIVHVEGNLFFGAADIFTEQTRRVSENPDLRILILKFRNAHNLDATGVMLLEELHNSMKERGNHLIICELRGEILQVLRHARMVDKLGRDHLFLDTPSNPPLSAAKALKMAKKFLGGATARVSVYAKHMTPATAKAEAKASVALLPNRYEDKPNYFGEI